MTNPAVEALLMQAREAIKASNFPQARNLIKSALDADPQNSQAWLLATYLTNDPVQQRRFLDNVRKYAPDDPALARRERQLFPPKAQGVFVPDPVQPGPARSTPARAVVADHVPTLADAVNLPPISKQMGWLPWLAIVGGIAIVILIMMVLSPRGQSLSPVVQNSPSEVVLRLYPALQAGDNAALANLFTDDVKELCANDFVRCLHAPLNDFQSYSISGENLSTNLAVIRLTIHYKGNAGDRCQDFQLLNTNQGWRIEKDMGGITACSTQMALLPGQSANAVATSVARQPSPASTATFDTTQIGILQTTTALAQTQNALIAAPTLTTTFLAPGFTQTALVGEQNSLNTAIAATSTQAVVSITQTAQWVGLTTGTPVAQTQIAASTSQAAAAYKAALKGTLAVAQNIQGHSTIVILNADGSNLKSLNVVGVDPVWSPDGKHIAYTNQEHQSSIHVMSADGSNDKELPIKDAPFGTGWATWLSDSTKLMIEGGTRITLHAVFVSGVNGANVSQILDDSHSGGWTSWSPDGKQILYAKDDQIWIVPTSGGTPHSLAKQPGARAAVWSPDEKQIAFDAGDDRDRGIYVMNADGSNLKRITSKNVYVALPTWSPDNTKIIALCNDNLCVMNVDGTNLLTTTADGRFSGRISWTK